MVAAHMCVQNAVEKLYREVVLVLKKGATYSPQETEARIPGAPLGEDRCAVPPTSTIDVVTLYPLFLHQYFY